MGLKPVQQPHPPIYLAAYVPPALRRAATASDGWLPSSLPLPALGQMIPRLHAFAREAGRDPARLEVIYLAGTITDSALDDAKRGVLSGSSSQVRADVGRLRDVGVTEIITWSGGDSIALLSGLERVRGVVG